MAITVKVVCYKSKVLSNNESPLMLRVTKDRKLKYVSLGISVKPEHWDFSKNQPRANCPNREFIELLIAEKAESLQFDSHRVKGYKSRVYFYLTC